MTKKDLLVIIPVTLSIALGILRIDVAEPHADEWVVLSVFNSSWIDFIKDFFDPQGVWGGYYPPLYYVMVKACGAVFGKSLIPMRLLSIVALAGLVLLSWYSFPMLTQSKDIRWRLFFALAVGLAPPHIWWAQTAKYTIWLYFIYALSIALAISLMHKSSVKAAIFCSISISAVIYTHYVGFLFAAAQFISLVTIGIWQRNFILVRRIIFSGLLVCILVAPLLPTVYRANQANEGNGYFAQYDEPPEFTDILRGVLIQWNFGYSLTPKHNVVALVSSFVKNIKEGSVTAASSFFWQVAPVLLAAFVLGISLIYSFFFAFRSKYSRLTSVFLILVTVLTFVFSLGKGMADRFMYFGFGTWVTLVLLTIGWTRSNSWKIPMSLGICILLLFGISLGTYYQRLNLKYPGSRLVIEYLNRNGSRFDLALIDEWIVETRGTPLDQSLLPPGIKVRFVSSAKDIPAELLRGTRTVSFLGGRPESNKTQLDAKRAANPNFSWNLIESWPSLERAERSIHVYRLSYRDGNK